MTARSVRAKGKSKADLPRLFWSVNEFAHTCGLAQDTVYRLIRDRRLAAVKVNGEHRIPDSEIKRLTAEAMENLADGAA